MSTNSEQQDKNPAYSDDIQMFSGLLAKTLNAGVGHYGFNDIMDGQNGVASDPQKLSIKKKIEIVSEYYLNSFLLQIMIIPMVEDWFGDCVSNSIFAIVQSISGDIGADDDYEDHSIYIDDTLSDSCRLIIGLLLVDVAERWMNACAHSKNNKALDVSLLGEHLPWWWMTASREKVILMEHNEHAESRAPRRG